MNQSQKATDIGKVLKQRTRLNTETFQLEAEGMRIHSKGAGATNEVLVGYSGISATHTLKSYPRNWLKTAGVLCLFIGAGPFGVLMGLSKENPWVSDHFVLLATSLVGVVVLIEILLAYFYYFKRIEIYAINVNDQFLHIAVDKPDRETVKQFLEAMNREKARYLVRRIQRLIELDSSFEIGSTLAGLLNSGIITDAQCSELEKELKADSAALSFGFAASKQLPFV